MFQTRTTGTAFSLSSPRLRQQDQTPDVLPSSYLPSLVSLQNGLDVEEEVELGEALEDAAFGPSGGEGDSIAVQKLPSDLFDGGLFEVGWQRCLASGWGRAWKNVTAGVGETGGRNLVVDR